MRVGIYARTSRAEGGDETSIPVQLADCRERVEQEGWTFVDEYVDAGISGWKRKTRPAYERLFADAESGRIEAVLVRDYERLLRNDTEGKRWLDLFEAKGFAQFKFADEADINLRRAADRRVWKERVAAAVYYSDRMGEKIRATKKASKTQGVYTGGGPVFGYARGPVIDPEQAAVIHDIVKRLAQHQTVYRIVADLNDAGVRTASGVRWQPKTLRRMMLGEHLTGTRGFPRVLTDIEAAVIREQLKTQPKANARLPGRRFPLTGLLVCSECGTKLSTGTNGYRCLVSHGGCGAVSIKATPLERWLALEGFKHYIAERESGRRKPKPAKEPAADVAPIMAELADVEDRLTEVQDSIVDGSLSVAAGKDVVRRLENQRRELTEQLARTLPPVVTGPTIGVGDIFTEDEVLDAFGGRAGGRDYADDSFRERWKARQLTESEVNALRDLYVDVVERVTVRPRESRGRAFDPSRVEVAWR